MTPGKRGRGAGAQFLRLHPVVPAPGNRAHRFPPVEGAKGSVVLQVVPITRAIRAVVYNVTGARRKANGALRPLARGPRHPPPTKHMHVKVADGLASIRALIQHQPIALLVQLELPGDFGREAHERSPDIGRLAARPTPRRRCAGWGSPAHDAVPGDSSHERRARNRCAPPRGPEFRPRRSCRRCNQT